MAKKRRNIEPSKRRNCSVLTFRRFDVATFSSSPFAIPSLFLVAWLWVSGCAAPGPTARNYSVSRPEKLDPTTAFDAARAALTGLGYRIDELDRNAGLLSASADYALPAEESARRGLRISARRPTERFAEVRVLEAVETVRVYCKVLIRQRVTEAHRMFALDHRGLDTPGQTPIEREAATTARQNTVWRTIRRDRPAERIILARISDLSGAATQNRSGT